MAEESEAESEFDNVFTSSNSTGSDNESTSPPQSTVSKVKELCQKLLEVPSLMDDDKKGFSYAVYCAQQCYWGKIQNCFSDDVDNEVIMLKIKKK